MELKSGFPGHTAWPDYPERTEEEFMQEFGALLIYLRDVRNVSVDDTLQLLEVLQQTLKDDIEWNRQQIQ